MMITITPKILKGLPVVLFSFLVGGAILSYIIAVSLKHVDPWLPFISEAFGYPPQSTVFGFTFLVAGVILIFIGVVLNFQVVEEFKCASTRRVGRVVRIWSITSGLGFILSALSPTEINLTTPDQFVSRTFFHMLGAAFGIFGGLIFVISICVLSFYTKEKLKTSRSTFVLRVFLATISTISFIAMISTLPFQPEFSEVYKCSKRFQDDSSRATAEDFEYCKKFETVKLVAAILEWIWFLSFSAFFLTLRSELGQVQASIGLEIAPSYLASARQDHFEESTKESTLPLRAER